MSPARGPVRAVPDLDAPIRTGVYRSDYALSPSPSPEVFGNVTPIKKDSAELPFGVEALPISFYHANERPVNGEWDAPPLGVRVVRTVPPVPPAAAAPPAVPEHSDGCPSLRVLEDIRDALHDLRAELGRVR